MQIFSNKKQSLILLKEKPFKLEKEIQTLFENNLDIIGNLIFVKSEFRIKDYRIDTLAYDEESKSFVIIEYKRDRNLSVIDQGVTYLNLMLDYQADFIVEYNESCQTNLKRNEIDWSQSKIIFVSPAFTDYQKQSTNFKDLAIELWEIKRFENDMITINPIKRSKSAPSIKQIQHPQNSPLDKVTKELIVYDEDAHLKDKNDEVSELYDSFKNAILALSTDIEIFPKKLYIAFKKDKNNIVSIHLQNRSLKLWLNAKKGNLDDPKKLTKDVSNVGHWATGDYELTVSDTNNLEYIMSLVKQIL
ncbi:DUF5655 domain-containing protein [Gilliamella apicola]|uniref:DUF5655 domain-containing protein n=1 Tax=Gilliamella apicola TaxID=1196095 RepID=A0A2V4DTD9_9GAMM|nr:DUF5655 domain-containing protein [Gilliamella apicola]PXZ03483.1 hypothetical protein DKK79_11620 [Gilliamella apicola]